MLQVSIIALTAIIATTIKVRDTRHRHNSFQLTEVCLKTATIIRGKNLK
jgi:hypothetical protein